MWRVTRAQLGRPVASGALHPFRTKTALRCLPAASEVPRRSFSDTITTRTISCREFPHLIVSDWQPASGTCQLYQQDSEQRCSCVRWLAKETAV